MIVPKERFVDAPIMSLQTGARLATTTSPIVDPRQLHIIAFRVHGAPLDRRELFLHTSDIREVSSIGFIVNDEHVLMPIDDLVRLQQVIDFHFVLDDIRVETENGRVVGKVRSYSVDPDNFFVQQLYVKPPLLGSIVSTGCTIHRSQIVSINNQRIVVKNTTIPATAPQSNNNPAQDIVNQFRSPIPASPETSSMLHIVS